MRNDGPVYASIGIAMTDHMIANLLELVSLNDSTLRHSQRMAVDLSFRVPAAPRLWQL